MAAVSVFVITTPDEAEAVVARLEAAFADDGYPIDQLLIEGGARRRVEILFWDLGAEAALHAVAAALAGTDWCARLAVAELGDHDWVAKSLEGLAPVFAARIVVHGRHDRAQVPATALGLEIEAAQAFGSGHHGSTVGCLLAIQREIRAAKPRRPLDLGTGTGVLAIALAKLTHRPVLATDIDPIATKTAAENAALNAVHPLVTCLTANGPHHRTLKQNAPFDFVVANILARPLAHMANGIDKLCAPRATLILSGLRPLDKSRILSAYGRYGFRLGRADKVDEWLTLTLNRSARHSRRWASRRP